MQQNAVQKAIAPIMGKKVWHVYEVSSIFLSAHERNRVVNWSRFELTHRILIIGGFNLSFHSKSCYIPLDKKCFKSFSWNGSEFWKSQSTAFSLQLITVLHKPKKYLKGRLFQRKWATNLIKPLAVRRLPIRSCLSVRSTTNQVWSRNSLSFWL